MSSKNCPELTHRMQGAPLAMSETHRIKSKSASHIAKRGQMLVVAIAIMFVLLIIGGIFVAQIGRNLTAAARSKQNQSAEAYAEAAIRYCDANFTSSPEGADWRPTPTTPIGPNNGVTDPDYRWLQQGFTRLFFQGGRALVRVVYDPKPEDPRSQYMRIEAVGRPGDLNQGLDPTVFAANGNAPRQRKELIAYKQIGLTDYLFWFTNKDHRSYTNFLGIPAVNNSPKGLGGNGVADVAMVLGDPAIQGSNNGLNSTDVLFGAPIRSNGALALSGEVRFFMSPRGGDPNISNENVLAAADIVLSPNQDVNNDGILNDSDQQVTVTTPLTGPAINQNQTTNFVLPSSNAQFVSYQGIIRDGSQSTDLFGYQRSIPYLDPPTIDGVVAGTGINRYRAATEYSGTWAGTTNTGMNGWGTGVWIDNTTDLQPETTNGTGGYSLRADWLNPQANFAQHYWNGPYYRPPGVLIELLGDPIRMTRSDGKSFRKPDGSPITASGGNVVDIPLRRLNALSYTFPDGTSVTLPALPNDGDAPTGTPGALPRAGAFPGDKQSYGVNLVIMAEGNVRVKGYYGAISDATSPSGDHLGRVHLTIVSGGTAYVEGNILRTDGYRNGSGITYEKASTCSILAKDYVTVNTTMFMAPPSQGPAYTQQINNADLQYIGLPTDSQSFDPVVAFGFNPAAYTVGGVQSPLYLLVRHAANQNNSGGGSSAFNLAINPGADTSGALPATAPSQYRFNGVGVWPDAMPGGFPAETYPLGLRYVNSSFVPDNSEVNPKFDQRVFPLNGIAGAVFTPSFGGAALHPFLSLLGDSNVFHFTKDTTSAAIVNNTLNIGGYSTTEDYLMSGTMVAPLDVRIEAMLYAQERSFFVIPGYSFNQNPNDTRANFLATGTRPIFDAQDASNVHRAPFPFYNEPMDVKISIFGAISQNYSASPGDQAAWFAKWGYMPATHGSSGIPIPDQHLVNRTPKEAGEGIARGIEYIYDPTLPLPYYQPRLGRCDINMIGSSAAAEALRQNNAIRARYYAPSVPGVLPVFQTLPAVPKLPVCPGMLYFGPPDSPVVP